MKNSILIMIKTLLILNQITAQEIDTLKNFDSNGNLKTIQIIEDGNRYNHIIHFEYDESNRVIKEFTSDTLGNILPRIGLSEVMGYEYGEEGDNKIETIIYYDKKMNPSINDRYGYHKERTTFNNNGLRIEDWFITRSGKTFERIGYKYNDEGLMSEINYLDSIGALKNEGLAIIKLEYDEEERVVKEWNYNSAMQPFQNSRIPFYTLTNYLDGIECIKYFDAEMNELTTTKLSNCEPVPDIQLPNQKGELISIKETEGKIRIVHFWASWSTPCKYMNKRLVELKEKVNNEDVEIISIALEKEGGKENWLKTIKETNLNWNYHLCDFKSWGSEGALEFGVKAIPRCFVLDENGLLIGNNLRSVADIEKILKKKGKL